MSVPTSAAPPGREGRAATRCRRVAGLEARVEAPERIATTVTSRRPFRPRRSPLRRPVGDLSHRPGSATVGQLKHPAPPAESTDEKDHTPFRPRLRVGWGRSWGVATGTQQGMRPTGIHGVGAPRDGGWAALLEGVAYPAAVWSGAELAVPLGEPPLPRDAVGGAVALRHARHADARLPLRHRRWPSASRTPPTQVSPSPSRRTATRRRRALQTFWRLTLLPVPARLGDPVRRPASPPSTSPPVHLAATAEQHRQGRPRRRPRGSSSAPSSRRSTPTRSSSGRSSRRPRRTAPTGAGSRCASSTRGCSATCTAGRPRRIGRSFRDDELSLPRLAAEARDVVMAASPATADERGRELMQRHDIGAFLLVPLYAKGEVRGVMGFCWNDPEPLEQRAPRTRREAVARAHARRSRTRASYGDECRDRAHAAVGVLRACPPRVPGVEFAHLYHCATGGARVGGDFYDVVEAAPGPRRRAHRRRERARRRASPRWRRSLRSSMHVHALQAPSPRARARRDERPRHALAVRRELRVGVLRPARHERRRVLVLLGRASAARARAAIGGAARCLREPQLVLGVQPDARTRTTRRSLDVGDMLLLYTDGLIEARDPQGPPVRHRAAAALAVGRRGERRSRSCPRPSSSTRSRSPRASSPTTSRSWRCAAPSRPSRPRRSGSRSASPDLLRPTPRERAAASATALGSRPGLGRYFVFSLMMTATMTLSGLSVFAGDPDDRLGSGVHRLEVR